MPSNHRLVGSLQLHTQYQRSPALGHHGRDVSIALSWPDVYVESSGEKHLARVTSLSRNQRPETSVKGIVSGDGEGGVETEDSTSDSVDPQKWGRSGAIEESINIPANVPSHGRRRDRVFGRPHRFVGTPPTELNRSTMTDCGSSVPPPGHHCEHRIDRRDECKWWSVQPILRSEAHPVFVQPMKEHVIRRRRNLRSEPVTGISLSFSGVFKTGYMMRRSLSVELTADVAASTHSEEASINSDWENSLLDMGSDTFTVAIQCIKSASKGHSKSPLHSPPLTTLHRCSRRERHSIEESNASMTLYPPCRANPPMPLRILRCSDNGPGRTSSSWTLVCSPRFAVGASADDTGYCGKGRSSSGSFSFAEDVEMAFR